jgi:hypothetical protein
MHLSYVDLSAPDAAQSSPGHVGLQRGAAGSAKVLWFPTAFYAFDKDLSQGSEGG